MLTLHKSAAHTQPLDTLAYTWATVQGMAASDPDGLWSAHTAPLLLVIADEDNILDPATSAEQAERAAGELTVWVADQTSHVRLAWSAAVGQRPADHAWASHGG